MVIELSFSEIMCFSLRGVKLAFLLLRMVGVITDNFFLVLSVVVDEMWNLVVPATVFVLNVVLESKGKC